ncbi:hypothetical protein EK21DRAFT_103356 [Setomelanomma holmii]|uniref:SnoaL-like domain-containing protein n=1 Tax=Setomelanomma holmii TaxID=210430 RepID=A0A9P4H2S5_9PLEO|nr:hypothetical protein EK21DRAFT_103356 [Setomelanomma holmii]
MLAVKIIVLVLTALQPLTEAASPLEILARDVEGVESIRHIKNIQKQLSNLAQFGQWHDIGSLFSHNSTFIWANTTVRGASSIEQWLRIDSGAMDGLHPGSLNTLVAENPVISLTDDGTSAKGRWNGIWFQDDGKGGTRIQGGSYENRGKGTRIVAYHFTADSSGLLIPPATDEAPTYNGTIAQLKAGIQRTNNEDEVRNLMHTHGYYVDRRMWMDALNLYTNNTALRIANGTIYTGKAGVRKLLERMGPENLTLGINNDHLIFDMIVEVDPKGREVVTRGIEIAMLGDTNTRVASWEFNVFRNRFVKEGGLWSVQDVEITPLVVADYYKAWGSGGIRAPNTYIPPFMNVTGQSTNLGRCLSSSANTTIDDLERRLRRSAAYDGAENQSHAYGYFLDDLQAAEMGALFAKQGHKLSPFAGFYKTPDRITQANIASYGTNQSALQSSISFHWRPQPVNVVSQDGRSATLWARLLQPSTSINKAGSFNSAMYHDQVVLENGRWRLWSVTIDEFYWQSPSWKEGWANAQLRNGTAPNPEPAGWTKRYPPDVTLASIGERESTFRGGSGSLGKGAGLVLAWVCCMSSQERLVSGSQRVSGAVDWSLVKE